MKKTVKTPLALLASLVLMAGCSDDDSDREDAPAGPALLQMPVSESVLMIGGSVSEPDDEVLKGKPVFVNGCLGASNGEKNFLVVWPDGTDIDRADSDAIRFGDRVLEPGDSFTGRGKMVDTKSLPVQFPQVPLKCLGPNEEMIMWVQEITSITD